MFPAELGIVDRAHQIVEGREPDLLVFRAGPVVEQRKILAMRVIVADQIVEYHRVQKFWRGR